MPARRRRRARSPERSSAEGTRASAHPGAFAQTPAPPTEMPKLIACGPSIAIMPTRVRGNGLRASPLCSRGCEVDWDAGRPANERPAATGPASARVGPSALGPRGGAVDAGHPVLSHLGGSARWSPGPRGAPDLPEGGTFLLGAGDTACRTLPANRTGNSRTGARRYRPDQERSSTSQEDIEAEVSQEWYRALNLEVGDRAYIRPRTVRVFVT
jgi:hypothetical protein